MGEDGVNAGTIEALPDMEFNGIGDNDKLVPR